MLHLAEILSGIADGRWGIPEFQRDFDWSDSDVRLLLNTVFSGWPAGSLLLSDARDSPYELRPLEGGPELSPSRRFAILDGQQRLTSLYQALYGKGERRYAVLWDQESEADLDDLIISFRADEWNHHLSSLIPQAENRLIPLTALRDPTTFFEWRDALLDCLPENERPPAKEAITTLYSSRLSRMNEYRFPAVVLEEDLDSAAIARIFERVNRTGLRLNTFDLMVAKTYSTEWNLREAWGKARETHPDLSSFLGDDGMPLLQGIALLVGQDLRQSAVLQLEREVVRQHWEQSVRGASEAVSFLQERCGVRKPSFLPYSNMLAPLMALAMQGNLVPNVDVLERWFWHCSFSGAFDAAANTRLVAHYRALMNGQVAALRTGARPIDFRRSSKKTDRSLWAGVACYLATRIRSKIEHHPKKYEFAEFEVETLFSRYVVPETHDNKIGFRSVLNALIVPSAFAVIARRLSAEETLDFADKHDFIDIVEPQVNMQKSNVRRWETFADSRESELRDWLSKATLFPEIFSEPPQ